MDVISCARQLGKAIQEDIRYIAFKAAKEANDKDMELNSMIGKLNLIQMNYQNESEKETPDSDKLTQLDEEFKNIYGEIMLNPSMQNYEAKKADVDEMMQYIINLLTMCVNGSDPETAEPSTEDSCSGNCSSCGGCG